MSYENIDEINNIWDQLYDAKHCELIRIEVIPLLIESVSNENIIHKIFKDLKILKESKMILSRLKILEIMITNDIIKSTSLINIGYYKYYRELYDLFLRINDPIIRLTIGISIFRNMVKSSNNEKFKKYYHLAQYKNSKHKYCHYF